MPSKSVIMPKQLCREPDLHCREHNCSIGKDSEEAIGVLAHEGAVVGAPAEVPAKLASGDAVYPIQAAEAQFAVMETSIYARVSS